MCVLDGCMSVMSVPRDVGMSVMSIPHDVGRSVIMRVMCLTEKGQKGREDDSANQPPTVMWCSE